MLHPRDATFLAVPEYPCGQLCHGFDNANGSIERRPISEASGFEFKWSEDYPADGCARRILARIYLPIMRIVNEPGIWASRAPRPPPGGGGGAGPRSSIRVKVRVGLLSHVIVREPFVVWRFVSPCKLFADFS